MSWNDAYERKKHKENQKREIAAFKEAGMTEEQIQSFCELEDEQYRCDRRYRMHTQEFSDSDFDEEEGGDDGQSPLYERFSEQLTVSMEDEKIHYDRYAWVEEVDNPKLYGWLKTLPVLHLEFLTMVAFENVKRKDAAEILKIKQRTMERLLATWRKNIF